MNTANKLTMARVILIPVFLVLLYLDFQYSNYIAMGIYIIATLTDVADGIVARKHNQVTDFGKFMDPLADKVLTFAAMLWFIEIGLMPAWLVLIVIIREFMVTGMRLVAVAKDKVIAASLSGKIKTLVTNICLISMFLLNEWWIVEGGQNLMQCAAENGFILVQWLIITCWALICVTTVVSGVDYFVKNKEIMKLAK